MRPRDNSVMQSSVSRLLSQCVGQHDSSICSTPESFRHQTPPGPQLSQTSPMAAGPTILRNEDSHKIESVPEALVVADGQGRIVSLDPQAEAMFGYQVEELVGEPVEKLMPERFRNGPTQNWSRYREAPLARPIALGLDV